MSDFIKPYEIRYMLDGARKSVFETETELMKAYVILSRRGAYNLIMRNRNTNAEILPTESARHLA
jgi:prophage antirepressor-like protein